MSNISSTKVYLDTPPNNWDIILVFQISNITLNLPLVKNIDKEKFRNFRVYLVFLSMIGFVYKCYLEKNMMTNDITIYNIESIDLTYWYRVIYDKLMLNGKPIRPIIKLSYSDKEGDLSKYEISPLRLEVRCNNEILETFLIENNNKTLVQVSN